MNLYNNRGEEDLSNLSKKGQSSTEYLAIVSIALMLLIPATLVFTSYARSTNDEVMAHQLGVIGNTIMAKAEEMFVLGTGSWVTIDINIPNSVTNVEIANNNELVFTFDTVAGPSNAVFFSPKFDINNGTDCAGITCNLNMVPGLNLIRIELDGFAVNIKKMN